MQIFPFLTTLTMSAASLFNDVDGSDKIFAIRQAVHALCIIFVSK